MSFHSSSSFRTSSSNSGPVDTDQSTRASEFKVYKRRWLVLFAGFVLILVPSLHRSLISIANIFNDHIGTTITDFDRAYQLCLVTTLVFIIPMARLMNRYGLRRMIHLCILFVIAANICKALCCACESRLPTWIRSNRYQLLMLSEALNGVSAAIHNLVGPMIANGWFPYEENTLALVVVSLGYSVGLASSNYLTPLFVKSPSDLYILSYMFIASAALLAILIPISITRSRPKLPPSELASVSAQTRVPFFSGLKALFSCSSFVLIILVQISLNCFGSTIQLNQEDILSKQNYSNSFCGALIAQGYFLNFFFKLIGATWVDNSANYIRVGRIGAILFAISAAFFYTSILMPNIPNIIETANILLTFTNSVTDPAISQVMFRSASGVLQESSTAAVNVLIQQVATIVIIYSLEPLKSLSIGTNSYQAPLLIFASLIMIINFSYNAFFKPPTREKLQNKLGPNLAHFLDPVA